MSDRFDLSFKNKEVRVWLYIMVPFMTATILFMLFTEIHRSYMTSLLPAAAWALFLIWRFFYRRKQKKEMVQQA